MNAWKTINSDEVKALFEKESVLFGSTDGIPRYRAIEIFGSAAVEFAERMQNRDLGRLTSNGYGIGDYTAYYLTKTGVEIAATFANVSAIRDIEAQ